MSLNQNEIKNENEYSMKWLKFLIYFALFLNAVSYVVNGSIYLSGGLRMVGEDLALTGSEIYNRWPDVEILDKVYGTFLLLLAIFTIVTRFKLANYQKSGPVCLYILYVAGGAMNLIYSFAFVNIVNGKINMPKLIGSVAGTAFAIWANHKYFTNRRELFRD